MKKRQAAVEFDFSEQIVVFFVRSEPLLRHSLAGKIVQMGIFLIPAAPYGRGVVSKNAQMGNFNANEMAEARGFEPPVRLLAHTLSKRAP